MMKDRIKSAIVMLGGLAIILMLRHFLNVTFDIFWILFTVLSVGELVNIANHRKEGRVYKYVNYAYPIVFALILLVGYLVELKIYTIILIEMLVLVLTMLSLLFVPMLKKSYRSLTNYEKKNARDEIFEKALYTSYILIYPALLMSLMLLINHLSDFELVNPVADNNIFGLFAILFILVTSMLTDTMAMFCGMIFKGKKLCPRISYNKTISGFIGGVVFGILASIGMYGIFTAVDSVNAVFIAEKVALWQFLIIGLFSGLATSFGDLLGSYIKRRCFVKDFGNIFPGHGGFMDRFNGVIINTVVVLISFIIIF